jgi:hypothetical protein
VKNASMNGSISVIVCSLPDPSTTTTSPTTATIVCSSTDVFSPPICSARAPGREAMSAARSSS